MAGRLLLMNTQSREHEISQLICRWIHFILTSGWTKRYWTTMVETHQPELWPSVAPSKNLWRFILNKQITSRRRRRRIETAVILEKASTQTASRKNTPSSQMPGSLANFGRTKRTLCLHFISLEVKQIHGTGLRDQSRELPCLWISTFLS